MKHKNLLSLIALMALAVTPVRAEDEEIDSDSSLDMLVGASAAVLAEKCDCTGDSADLDSYERCVDKNNRKIVKLHTSFTRYAGISRSDLMSAMEEEADLLVEDCTLISEDPADDDDDFFDEF